MPNAPRVTRRTIPVAPGQLPAPATKLVITQVVQASQDSPFRALITVGAFYNSDDQIIWSTEQFVGYLGVESELSEEQASEAEEEEDTGREFEAEPEAETEQEAEATPEPSSSPVHSPAAHQFVSPRSRARRRREPYRQHPIGAFQGYNNREAAFSPYLLLHHSHLRPQFHPHSLPHRFPHPSTQPYPHYHCHHHHAQPSFPAPPSFVNPPAGWNPVYSGPVPGHWQASFQPNVGRWVHTWQPRPFDIPFR